jgi:hypothetical protein
MRKRQINNMHGGYRGRGVTINWGTTSPQQSEPIIQPLPEPYPDPIKPLEPPPLPNVPIKPVPPHSLVSVTSKSHPNIAGIVGLTLGGVGALTAIGVAADKYMKSRRSGIIAEENDDPILNLRPNTDDNLYDWTDTPQSSILEEENPQSEEWKPEDDIIMDKLWEEKQRAREHDERSRQKYADLDKKQVDFERRIAEQQKQRRIAEQQEQDRYSASLRRSNVRLGDPNDPVEFHYY